MIMIKAFNVTKNWKYDEYRRPYAAKFYIFFDKNFLVVLLLVQINCN